MGILRFVFRRHRGRASELGTVRCGAGFSFSLSLFLFPDQMVLIGRDWIPRDIVWKLFSWRGIWNSEFCFVFYIQRLMICVRDCKSIISRGVGLRVMGV